MLNPDARNKHWQNHSVNKTSDLMWHMAGADVDLDNREIKNELLLYYFYRFALEEELLVHFIKKFCKNKNRVLDVGCGSARISLVLSRYFKHVDAFDLSEKFILENKERYKKYKNISFSCLNTNELNLTEKYDMIFVGGVAMYLQDTEMRSFLDKVKLSIGNGLLISRDTMSNDKTNFVGDIKVYRSEADYLSFFDAFSLVGSYETATKNLFCSVCLKLPRFLKDSKLCFALFKFFIKCFIKVDLFIKVFRSKFFANKKANSNQKFYLFVSKN